MYESSASSVVRMACYRSDKYTAPEFAGMLVDLQEDSNDDVAKLAPFGDRLVVLAGQVLVAEVVEM